MLGYVTPARGVVLTPVTNFALHDRTAGTVSVSTSVGAWKKLARIRANSNIALAFHTRAHADHERPEYVLVQGRASVGPPVEDYPSTVLEQWERIEPWGSLGPLAKRWLRIYGRRVEVKVFVERVVVWPDLTCAGSPEVSMDRRLARPCPRPRRDRPREPPHEWLIAARPGKRDTYPTRCSAGWVQTRDR